MTAADVTIPQSDLLTMVLGPLGALVVVLIAAVVLWRENRALQASIMSRETAWQSKLDEEKDQLQSKLDEERNVRLREAMANAKAMEHWNNELHLTQKQLTVTQEKLTEAVYRQNLLKDREKT